MKGLDKKLDDAWSLLGKVRAGFVCEVCGCGPSKCRLNTHHIVGRRNRNLRWELRNSVCLCVGHHKFYNQSAHEDSPWFNERLQKYRKKDYDYVNSIKNNIRKWIPSEKEELLDTFKKMIKEYEEGNSYFS